MHSDDVIWGLINNGFCSFKVKTITSNFCRNEYNVNGHCSRSTCPLANSRYATVREKEGKCYLYVKTVERQHMPSKLWEVIPLDKNLEAAFKQLDTELIYWPSYMIHKCKQRLVKITQYLIRMRKLRKQPEGRTVHRIHKKVERRERSREERAEKVAQIDNKIKAELLERLKQGTYGDIYNFRPEAWNEVLDQQEEMSEEDAPEFIVDEEEEDYDKEEEEERYYEYGGFSSGSDDENFDSDEDLSAEDKTEGKADFAKYGFDDSMFDIGGSTKKSDGKGKGTKSTPAPKATTATKTDTGSKKRPRAGDAKGRTGKKKKTHIEIEYDDKESKEVQNW